MELVQLDIDEEAIPNLINELYKIEGCLMRSFKDIFDLGSQFPLFYQLRDVLLEYSKQKFTEKTIAKSKEKATYDIKKIEGDTDGNIRTRDLLFFLSVRNPVSIELAAVRCIKNRMLITINSVIEYDKNKTFRVGGIVANFNFSSGKFEVWIHNKDNMSIYIPLEKVQYVFDKFGQTENK